MMRVAAPAVTALPSSPLPRVYSRLLSRAACASPAAADVCLCAPVPSVRCAPLHAQTLQSYHVEHSPEAHQQHR